MQVRIERGEDLSHPHLASEADGCPLSPATTHQICLRGARGEWAAVDGDLLEAKGVRRLPAVLRRLEGGVSMGEHLTAALARGRATPSRSAFLDRYHVDLGVHVATLGRPEMARTWARLSPAELVATLLAHGAILENAAGSPAVFGALMGEVGPGPAADALWLAHAGRVLARLLGAADPAGPELVAAWLSAALEGGRIDARTAGALLGTAPALIGLGRRLPEHRPLTARLCALARSRREAQPAP